MPPIPVNPPPHERDFNMSLNALIDSCGRAQVHSDVARVVAEYNKVDGVLMVAYSNAKWYSFNKVKNGWEVSNCDKFIRIQLSEEIAPLFKARSDFFWLKANENNDGTLRGKAGVLLQIEQLLKNSSYKSRVVHEIKALAATTKIDLKQLKYVNQGQQANMNATMEQAISIMKKYEDHLRYHREAQLRYLARQLQKKADDKGLTVEEYKAQFFGKPGRPRKVKAQPVNTMTSWELAFFWVFWRRVCSKKRHDLKEKIII